MTWPPRQLTILTTNLDELKVLLKEEFQLSSSNIAHGICVYKFNESKYSWTEIKRPLRGGKPSKMDIRGKPYNVKDGELLCCFDVPTDSDFIATTDASAIAATLSSDEVVIIEENNHHHLSASKDVEKIASGSIKKGSEKGGISKRYDSKAQPRIKVDRPEDFAMRQGVARMYGHVGKKRRAAEVILKIGGVENYSDGEDEYNRNRRNGDDDDDDDDNGDNGDNDDNDNDDDDDDGIEIIDMT